MNLNDVSTVCIAKNNIQLLVTGVVVEHIIWLSKVGWLIDS